MNFKTLALGLAVASVATVSMAKPVAYTIDPTHTATVFSWDHFGFLHHQVTSQIFRVPLMLMSKTCELFCECDNSTVEYQY